MLKIIQNQINQTLSKVKLLIKQPSIPTLLLNSFKGIHHVILIERWDDLFEDQNIFGRGIFDRRIRFQKDYFGKIKVFYVFYNLYDILISDNNISSQYFIKIQTLKNMGLLTDLGPMESFEEMQKQQQILKRIGVKQFLHILQKYGKWQKQEGLTHIKWGQQIEGHFLKINQHNQLSLCLQNISEEYKDLDYPLMFQYGSWMFEMIPLEPYSTKCDFKDIIQLIRIKYRSLHKRSRIAITIPVIPFLGWRQTQQPITNNQVTQSLYLQDNHISQHPRFKALSQNIRFRRGGKVQINVPIYHDKKTNLAELAKTQPNPQFIHMDAMGFGMGNACLQCTFSTLNLSHARYLYDQLNTISPIFLALTAGTPFYKGKVSDWDVRWNIIGASVDDRNAEQRDPNNQKYIPCSRYCQANYYLWQGDLNKKQYNDFYTGIKQDDLNFIRQIAEEKQIKLDEQLQFHLANIFKRDYLISHTKFKTMSQEENYLFQMLNGTNWNSVRLKIPINDDIGWRVQFRTMEVQLTPDQNSAYSIFIHLITRILHQNNNLNFYIPISKVRQNFFRAHSIDALMKKTFYFRTNIHQKGDPVIQQLTVHEIIFGKGNYRGLFYLIKDKFKQCVCNEQSSSMYAIIQELKLFIQAKTTGKRLTLAQWMRNYIKNNKHYEENSILSKKLMDELMLHLYKISTGQIIDQHFLPIFRSIPKQP